MRADKQEQLIRQELIKLISSYSDNLKVAKVLSVNQSKKTCKVKILDNDLEATCRLRASEDGSEKGFWYSPKLGSTVIIGRMVQFKRHVLIMVTEVEKVTCVADSFVFNDGGLGGLVKSEVVKAKINELVEDINTIKAIFAAWVPVPLDGGLVLKTASATWAAQLLAPSVKSEFENPKVKHG